MTCVREYPVSHGPHGADEFHHHHSHAAASRHTGSHHLLTVEDLAAVWQPVLEAAGAFDSITKTTVGGKDGYGVAVVQAKYENAAVTFTLSYTPEGKLGGLFFK